MSLAIVCPALADEALARRGQYIAADRCSACHATQAEGDSPNPAAPRFRSLEARYPVPMLVEALRTGVITGHDRMPLFEFDPYDVRALVAHIDNFAPDAKKYLSGDAK